MQNELFSQQAKLLKQHRKTVLFEGWFFLLLGLLAIAMPAFFTISLDYLFGVLFIAGGIMQLYRVVETWGMAGTWPALFWSLISVWAGGIMVVRPMIGLFSITLILIAYFFLEFIAKFSFAIRFGVGSQRFWLFLSGLLSLFLAIIIFAGLPGTATWVLGLLVGIDLALFGAMALAFHSTLRA